MMMAGLAALPLILLASPFAAYTATKELADAAERLRKTATQAGPDQQVALNDWASAHQRFVDSATMFAVVGGTVVLVLVVPLAVIGIVTS